MGHVPPGAIPRDRSGPYFPRRQCRKGRAHGALSLKPHLGRWGESAAAGWLETQGLEILDRNFNLADGEIDLLAMDGGQRVVVEVRVASAPGDPLDAVDLSKRARVRRLAGGARVDFVGIGIRAWGLEIHWLPG